MLVAMIGLPSCAGMGPGFETPTVVVNSFRALPSEGVVPNFEIGLRVINPNSQALTLRGVAYTISLGGHELIKGAGHDLPVIEGYGEGDIRLTASANLFAGIRLVSELMKGPGDSLPYEFEAKRSAGSYFASGSGRTWKWTTIGFEPLPPSFSHGTRSPSGTHRPRPFQPASGSSMRPSKPLV
jgi:hypothetical protein